MSLIIAILGAIFAVFSVIVIHEFGHFIVAKWCGVKILKFSIGFGKALWKRTGKDGTEYVIGFLPLGGYVKMFGEWYDVVTREDAGKAYNLKPVWARMAIVVAGPLINFILAAVVMWLFFVIGFVHTKPIIGTVPPGSIAAVAGLKSGDELYRIDNRRTDSWQAVTMAIVARVGEKDSMRVEALPKGSQQPVTYYLPLANWKIEKQNPDLLNGLGLVPYQPPIPAVVEKIMPNSPAINSDLHLGDRIKSINNHPVNDWQSLVNIIRPIPNQKISLKVERGGEEHIVPLVVGSRSEQSKLIGYLGISPKPISMPPELEQHIRYSVFGAILPAIAQVWRLIDFNFVVFKKLLTGKLSFQILGGPISIFQTAGQASQVGLSVYLGFVAYLSAALGFLNLLPIPGLDGGHLLFQVVEGLIGRPISQRVQLIALQLGFFIIILLMLMATLNDILRIV